MKRLVKSFQFSTAKNVEDMQIDWTKENFYQKLFENPQSKD